MDVTADGVRFRTSIRRCGIPHRPGRVLQELLHRYTAIGRRDAIAPAWDAIAGVVDVIHPIDVEDVMRARRLVASAPTLSARDAVHLAVMQRRGITRILNRLQRDRRDRAHFLGEAGRLARAARPHRGRRYGTCQPTNHVFPVRTRSVPSSS